MDLTLHAVEGEFAVCKVASTEGVNLADDFAFIGKTPDELSLVCRASAVPTSAYAVDAPWRLMAVQGPLDFGLTGIMAALSGALAGAGIPLFAVSTFDTDYLLVKAHDFEGAAAALRATGCTVHVTR